MNDVGRFIWYELYTIRAPAGGSFYCDLLDWTVTPFQGGYQMLINAGAPVGGLLELSPDMKDRGVTPHWFAYLGTEDVDATFSAAVRLGGKALKAPFDIPNVGRLAILKDPQGASFGLYRPAFETAPQASRAAVGSFSWAELATTEPDAAFAFYTELFGWVKSEVVDLGARGSSTLYTLPGLDLALGGIMQRPPELPVSTWLYSLRVPNVEIAARRIRELGGKVTLGPMDAPGEDRIAQALDPQGTMFALRQFA